jgi:hypothetical protein
LDAHFKSIKTITLRSNRTIFLYVSCERRKSWLKLSNFFILWSYFFSHFMLCSNLPVSFLSTFFKKKFCFPFILKIPYSQLFISFYINILFFLLFYITQRFISVKLTWIVHGKNVLLVMFLCAFLESATALIVKLSIITFLLLWFFFSYFDLYLYCFYLSIFFIALEVC